MKQQGQALILFIVAIAAAISIITTAVLALVGQAKALVLQELGERVYYAAESGSEQAIMKLVRNPSTCPPPGPPANESFVQDSVNITITYEDSLGVCAVTSQAQKDNVLRKIQFSAGYDNNPVSLTYRKFNICCWKEIA